MKFILVLFISTYLRYLRYLRYRRYGTYGTVGTIHTKKGARGLKNAAVERRRAAALSYHAD